MTEHQTTAQLLQQGLFHHRQGQIQMAMERYIEVLKTNPNNGEALYYVGVIACQEGQFKQGVDLARKAIANGLNTAKAHNLLGQALDRLGEHSEALTSFERAIKIDPDFAEAHGNRANILADAGMPAEALASYTRALALNPESLSDLINRGALLQDIGRHADALADYDKASALAPANPAVTLNKANALAMLGRYAEAEALYDEVAKKEPKSALALTQKALTIKQLGRLDEARTLLDQAVALDPKDASAAYALAQMLLSQGDWRKGFPLYEQRAHLPSPSYQPLEHTQWAGEGPGDFRLVLVAERALGDTVQMARYASLLAARGHPVWLLVPDVLAPLMRTLPGVERVVTTIEELKSDPRRILWAPVMSLPRLLHLLPDNVPAQEPYLKADAERAAQWAEKLKGQESDKALKVGVFWHDALNGGAPLADLAPLADIPGVRLISLQKRPGPDIGQVPFAQKLERVIDENDFSAEALLDMAALMVNLDLVVSIDSMPVHLAGALGVPVFLALPANADWRWLTGRDDTPWYPATKLFRQGADRDWAPVFKAIAEAQRQRTA